MKPFLTVIACTASAVCAQEGIAFGGAHSPFHLDLRPSMEAMMWAGNRPAPAMIELTNDILFAPRLTLAMDASAGTHWFLHATTRWDRGFDAGSNPGGELRLDEIMLRWRPFEDQRLNVQIGKFPSVFGAWSGSHDFFDDPFLLAPLPYSQIIGINTRNPDAVSPTAINARANGTSAPFSTLSKDQWTSMIWGPDYGTGASVFGSTEYFDYALELKNTALSAHPDSWPEIDFQDPTLTARIGYRPNAAWSFGQSASRGSWLEANGTDPLLNGAKRDDLMQSTLGFDMRWSHHNLILSGEVVLSEFETPSAGDLRTGAWFIQARWKAAPRLWLTGRFGQILANDATDANGAEVPWQPNIWRAELGAGWHLSPNLLVKFGYSYTHTDGDQDAGRHLFGAGLGWRF